MVLAEVDMPGSILALIKVDRDQLGLYIKRSLAVELYREGKLSVGKAAELAGVKSKWEMLMLLSAPNSAKLSHPFIGTLISTAEKSWPH